MLRYYKILTTLIAPAVPLWLTLRGLKGKEEPARIGERFGKSATPRPEGTLLWIHAASVGEANSVLALIEQLNKRFPALHILLTTGTVTSAQLMKHRLPAGVLHHYAPVDTPEATERFIKHWLPDAVWFVESELWPNLIDAAKRYYCLMALINARMSERSFHVWRKYKNTAREMLSSFRLCFAQTEADAQRLRELGAPQVITSGNLKYDAPPLPCDEGELMELQQKIDRRVVWLAASTHPGEEEAVGKAHVQLKNKYPNLLTIVVPRHSSRGAECVKILSAYGRVSQRSLGETIHEDTGFYVADTMGELGLFYRLAEVVFMGGSLVPHGGQNPLEPALLSCTILSGPYVKNFAVIYQEMLRGKAAAAVTGAEQLAAAVGSLLESSDLRYDMQKNARAYVTSQTGSSEMILDIFAPVFAS